MISNRSSKTVSYLLAASLLVAAAPAFASEESVQQKSGWKSGAKGIFFGCVALGSARAAFDCALTSAIWLPGSIAVLVNSPADEKGGALFLASLGLGAAALAAGLGYLSLWSLKKSYFHLKTYFKNVDEQKGQEEKATI